MSHTIKPRKIRHVVTFSYYDLDSIHANQMFLEEAESLAMREEGKKKKEQLIGFTGLVHWHTIALPQSSSIHQIHPKPEQGTSLILQTKKISGHFLCYAVTAYSKCIPLWSPLTRGTI